MRQPEIIDSDDAPKLASEVTHAYVGVLLWGMRDTLDKIISIRLSEYGALLDNEEGELIAIKSSLDFLLSDIRESRIAAARKIRIVQHG
jgi:hypothetical protein